jgi:hypothetical protein
MPLDQPLPPWDALGNEWAAFVNEVSLTRWLLRAGSFFVRTRHDPNAPPGNYLVGTQTPRFSYHRESLASLWGYSGTNLLKTPLPKGVTQ